MDNPVYCSFCGKSQKEVEVMLAGSWPAFICSDCVEDARVQVSSIVADRHAQETLIGEVLRCTFCLPQPLRLDKAGAR